MTKETAANDGRADAAPTTTFDRLTAVESDLREMRLALRLLIDNMTGEIEREGREGETERAN